MADDDRPQDNQQPEQEARPIDDIWERLPDETPRAYVAFRMYLDMGDARTVIGAYRRMQRRPQAKEPSPAWDDWSKRHEWAARADAYDRYQRLVEMKVRHEAQQVVAVQWAERRIETRSKAFEMGKALFEKAEQMLRFPLAHQETVKERYEDGRPKTVVIVEPAKWNIGTIARLALVANQLMRISSELETGRNRVDLKLIRSDAEALANETGQDPDEIMRMAEQLAANTWGQDLSDDE